MSGAGLGKHPPGKRNTVPGKQPWKRAAWRGGPRSLRKGNLGHSLCSPTQRRGEARHVRAALKCEAGPCLRTQGLRLCASSAGGMGSIPGQGRGPRSAPVAWPKKNKSPAWVSRRSRPGTQLDLSLQAPQAGNLGCVWRRGDMEGPPRKGSEKELLYQEKGETSCDPLPATPTGWGR